MLIHMDNGKLPVSQKTKVTSNFFPLGYTFFPVTEDASDLAKMDWNFYFPEQDLEKFLDLGRLDLKVRVDCASSEPRTN